jgi:hypothetical protein
LPRVNLKGQQIQYSFVPKYKKRKIFTRSSLSFAQVLEKKFRDTTFYRLNKNTNNLRVAA